MCKVTRTSFVVRKETIFIILKHSPQANMVNISGWIVYLDLETVKQNIIRQSALRYVHSLDTTYQNPKYIAYKLAKKHIKL